MKLNAISELLLRSVDNVTRSRILHIVPTHRNTFDDGDVDDVHKCNFSFCGFHVFVDGINWNGHDSCGCVMRNDFACHCQSIRNDIMDKLIICTRQHNRR